jgi:hypothetical protein
MWFIARLFDGSLTISVGGAWPLPSLPVQAELNYSEMSQQTFMNFV